ncbi:MAG: transporter substrate-binding domain-containing protein [Candidatus Cloacimonetes bacterium]|nr:transporter substrate-binding domain-containing protein [Candidatus Cloacimonadota bacterium]
MKIKNVIIFLAVFLILNACTPKPAVLHIGMKADFPPFEYREKSVLTGFDIDLAREIGKKLGYKIQFVEMEFDELLPAVYNNKIDLAISAMTINNQRLELVDFSMPYFSADQVILSRSDCDINIKQDSDLKQFKIGTQNGTTGQYYLQYNLVETGELAWDKLIGFDNNNQALLALLNREIDLIIMDNTAAEAFARIKPLKICYVIPTEEEYGIAMKKDSPLREPVNNALTEIMKSNVWTQMITAYMSE